MIGDEVKSVYDDAGVTAMKKKDLIGARPTPVRWVVVCIDAM